MDSGLIVMDSPAMTDFVMTGLMGAGAHLMINCCGAGPANSMPFTVGASGPSAILPTIKVTGGSDYYKQPGNGIDIDAGVLLEKPECANEIAKTLEKYIIAVASGKSVCTETDKGFFINFPMEQYQA